MSRLRTAVIGVGQFGRNHARILATLPQVELVAVVDTLPDRAAEVASAAGAAPVMDCREVLGTVDAVVVAVPTDQHRDVARPFLDRGVAVLVEKPLALSAADADVMVAAAAASGATLAVGHTERYNPAVSAILPLVQQPRFIEVHRLGAFPGRSLDIDVIFDLMIHDLDIAMALVRSDAASIDAVGVPVLTDRTDIANVRLRFESGCIANLTASRISRDRVRKLRIFQPDCYLSVDYASQDAEVWRLERSPGQRPNIAGGRLEIARDEPLRLELIDFVEAARSGRAPRVTGLDGRRAVALAERLTRAIGTAASGVGGASIGVEAPLA